MEESCVPITLLKSIALLISASTFNPLFQANLQVPDSVMPLAQEFPL